MFLLSSSSVSVSSFSFPFLQSSSSPSLPTFLFLVHHFLIPPVSFFTFFLILSFSVCLNIPVSTVAGLVSEGRRMGRGMRDETVGPHSNRLVPARLHSL
jgi:hypothetical protein